MFPAQRSICLLKWPSRFLVSLITLGLMFLTSFLWILDRLHKQSVRDLELKTVKLGLVIVLVLVYLAGVEKLINLIENSENNANFVHDPPPNSSLVEAYRSEKLKTAGAAGGADKRQFNADKNGVNYYKLLLEGSTNGGKSSSKNGSLYSLASCARSDGTISEV